jgi:hypothetical protein
MATDWTDASRDMSAFRRIEECSIDERYCALDDLGLDMDRILKLNLTLHQVRELYIGLLRWQLIKMDLQLKIVATLR